MSNIKKITRLFDDYRKDIKNTWEEFLLLHYSLSTTKKQHKVTSITSEFKRELVFDGNKYDYKDLDIHNFIDKLLRSKLGDKALIEAVSLTETYLQSLTEIVYRDYPQKLTNANADTPASELKLIHLIINSTTKDDMIEALIEEKIRGIFYGRPLDFFEKDKAKIGLGTEFKTHFPKSLPIYSEISARRNIIIHNGGKVDSKYIKETGSPITKGRKVVVDKDYLKKAIIVLRGVSAATTKLVLQHTYNANISNLRVTSLAKSLIEYTK